MLANSNHVDDRAPNMCDSAAEARVDWNASTTFADCTS